MARKISGPTTLLDLFDPGTPAEGTAMNEFAQYFARIQKVDIWGVNHWTHRDGTGFGLSKPDPTREEMRHMGRVLSDDIELLARVERD